MKKALSSRLPTVAVSSPVIVTGPRAVAIGPAGRACSSRPNASHRAANMTVIYSSAVAYIICEPCIGTKDTACVDVCPVDCIHPRKDEAEFATPEQLYIHPDECID